MHIALPVIMARLSTYVFLMMQETLYFLQSHRHPAKCKGISVYGYMLVKKVLLREVLPLHLVFLF